MESLIEHWRELVFALVALVGAYVVILLARLARLSRAARSAAARPSLDPVPSQPPATLPIETREPRMIAIPAGPVGADFDALSGAPRVEAPAWREPGGEPVGAPANSPPPADFEGELARSTLEREVARLRRESAALRDEVAALRDDINRLKANRNVSPLYSEAAPLAERGVSADGIAGRCGISLGEAELVAALARARVPAPDDNLTDLTDGHDGHEGNDGPPGPGHRTGTLG